MTSQLNANAKEWVPTGDFSAFSLPDSAVAEGEGLEQKSGVGTNGSMNTVPGSPPQEQYDTLQWNDMVSDPPPYFPSFMLAGQSISAPNATEVGEFTLEGIDWKKEFDNVMALTRELLERQLNGEQDTPGRQEAAEHEAENAVSNPKGLRATPKTTPGAASILDPAAYPDLPGCDVVRPLQSGKWLKAASAMKGKAQTVLTNREGREHNGDRVHGTSRIVGGHGVASSVGDDDVDEFGRPLPPLTANGNRRWKKPTKGQQKREAAQKNAFEAFANALLHSVSPFMAPLRERCKTSLPHIKVDQRFGKVGQPHTAVAQFVVAPLVTNYRPRHFHDLTPGDLMEFHYDFAQVLKQLKSADEVLFGYGPVWKRYAVPFCYVNCKEYRDEVLSLCPDEVPNMRVEAIYEDDVVKDITDVVLSVEELEPLQNMSFLQAMGRRVNLAPLFDAFDTVFQPIENYRIIIKELHSAPSTYLIQTSQHEVNQKPQPLVLYNDPKLWYDLPVVSRIKVESTVGRGASERGGAAASGQPGVMSASSLGGPASEKEGQGRNAASGGTTGRKAKDISTDYQNGGGYRFNRAQIYGVLIPLVGSAAFLTVTGFILWRRRKTK
ncbi:hypothetical protein, conserved [Trypanosoma brucei gambiense DAL972]|uniref:Uncharacterized protein n=1 Tax=Trypanosoma brucei gambiense (strain MHOM/CI/86/DAL972) TaxID=679716 RepID=C9ZX99_TRYB9|nr:hypothetical protein, conserved [Trypanosoma brucei gambiense DAL972]CBH14043.1 hypothetical protein, conserved [Trypanosoma brucei gambiense DAL972]|eukprot:XP_011776314.1 hypothetical protein, conserved [Trypanosoma brucei gambiense DAL972]